MFPGFKTHGTIYVKDDHSLYCRRNSTPPPPPLAKKEKPLSATQREERLKEGAIVDVLA